MFKTLFWICVVLAILGFPVWSWHLISPSTPIKMMMLDKTVAKPIYREHKALMWVLNNLKYTDVYGLKHRQKLARAEGGDIEKMVSEPFQYNRDYYGFFPDVETHAYPGPETKLHAYPKEQRVWVERDFTKDKVIDQPDVVYVTDTYGVYHKEFFGQNPRGDRSPYIYGGMKPWELAAIKRLIRPTTLFVSEWNDFNSPTDVGTRKAYEKLLGVEWLEWMGRYFEELDPLKNEELPWWVVHNWEKQHGKKWPYKGPGFVLASNWDQIEVLRENKVIDSKHTEVREVGLKRLEMAFTKYAIKNYHVRDRINYYYWFDFVKVTNPQKSRVLGWYELDIEPEGQKILKKLGLNWRFPAVVYSQMPNPTYYFSGDFSDHDLAPKFWNSRYIDVVYPWFIMERETNQKQYFWEVYFPIVKTIFEKHVHVPQSRK